MKTDRTRDTRTEPTPCANEGCLRAAAPGERYCDTCQLERALFRRNERPCLSGAARIAER